MALAASIPMYFRLTAESIKDTEVCKKVRDLGGLCLGELSSTPTELTSGMMTMFVSYNDHGSYVVVTAYNDGLVTVDLHHHTDNADQYDTKYIRCLEIKMASHLGASCIDHNTLHLPIRRGQALWPYNASADDRLLEMDFEALLYETNSAWQNIRIIRTRMSGNTLFLDSEAMLGEGDLIYTKTLCRIGHEDYTNKTVLILGGGDGGILHELRKENVGFVTMAEIDEEVIKACRTYLRGACGDSLDSMQGSNYQIIIEDCVKVLKDSIANGITYNYVINDLTEFPLDTCSQASQEFDSALIMKLSLAVLKPDGKLLARGNCVGAVAYRSKFESLITELGYQFIRRDIYVPSFHEMYCVYEIFRPSVNEKASANNVEAT